VDLYARGLASQFRRARAARAPRSDGAALARLLDRATSGFAPQRASVEDTARERALECGRRAGKTGTECLAPIAEAVAYPRSSVAYLSTSIVRAMDTVWSDMLAFLDAAGIPYTARETTRTIDLQNGSRIWVSGVETKKQANKIRGRLKRTRLVVIDEAQDWPTDLLRYLYQVVVWPSLADVGGRTMMAGTGTAPRGFWYEHLQKQEVSKHRWTMFDNPHIADARATLEKALRDKGITASVDEVIACDGVGIDAEIAQEYFCRFVAGEKQIFHVSRERNAYAAQPIGQWYYVIGVDWGTVDKAAVVVWGWTPASPRLYLVAYEQRGNLSATEQIALAMKYVDAYQPLAVVADPATGGSAFILDLQERFGAPAEPAEKAGKVSAVLLLRDALRRGEVLLPDTELPEDESHPKGEFARALEAPEWDLEQVQKSLKGHMPDLVDAALYAFRKARQYDYQAPEAKKDEETRVLEAMREEQRRRHEALAEILGG
jgi:hypothetical protein